jgi:hypothetical protein
MAGEWIPVDCNLGTKPEVLVVAAATHGAIWWRGDADPGQPRLPL